MTATPLTKNTIYNIAPETTIDPEIDLSSQSFISNAIINIRNLRLRTYIGFNPEERTKQQDVVVNIEINYEPREGVLDDRVEDALNYKTITKKVIQHVEAGHFLLLEKLVADLLFLCSDHPNIEFARVTVDKPHALRFADSVSLTLEHHRQHPDLSRSE